eukprot:4062618-Pyramimonas_sp.AAC.1
MSEDKKMAQLPEFQRPARVRDHLEATFPDGLARRIPGVDAEIVDEGKASTNIFFRQPVPDEYKEIQ